MKNRLLAIVLPAILVACSSSPSPVLPPVMLKPIKTEIRVSNEWHRTIGDGVSDGYLKMPPSLSQDTGYAADASGQFMAFSLKNGETIWQHDYKLPFSNAPVVAGDTVFIGTLQGELLALDSKQGKILWREQLSSEILAPVAANERIVVAKTVDGTVTARSYDSGRQLWSQNDSVPSLTLRGQSAPLIINDILIYATDEGRIKALSLRSGTELWSRTVAIPKGGTELARMIDIDATPVFYDDTIYVSAYQGRLAAINLHSGRIIWVRDIATHTGLVVDAYRLYVSDSEGQVWALDRKSGATLWKQEDLLRRAVTAPALQSGYIAMADFNGFIHWLAREDGRIVARTRMSRHGGTDESEDYEYLKFAKWNNILAVPRSVDATTLLAMDRTGWLEAFRLQLAK